MQTHTENTQHLLTFFCIIICRWYSEWYRNVGHALPVEGASGGDHHRAALPRQIVGHAQNRTPSVLEGRVCQRLVEQAIM